MRATIRRRLMGSVRVVNGRVFEPYVAKPNTQRPYLVLKALGERDAKISVGFDVLFEVWVYVDRTSQVEVDDLVDSVVLALNRQELETVRGHKFELRYEGCSSDYYDPDLS